MALSTLALYPYLAYYLSFPFPMPRTPFTQISNVTSLNRATAPTSALVIVLARALSSAGFALVSKVV